METKQETKSLPRNRKCGNCRYFEPAPLWRKGWCRNPRLYDRRANHLVDAATIDCEQVFRARIYWEPVPISEMAEASVNTGPGYSPFVSNGSDEAQADGGNRLRNGATPADGVLRSRSLVNNPSTTDDTNLPMIVRRERAAAAPGLVAKPSRLRYWLNENIPYYDKIDGPISRMNIMRVAIWVVLGLVVLFILFNVLGGKKGSTGDQNQPDQTTSSAVVFGNTTPTVNSNPNQVTQPGKLAPTPTLSSVVPTQTPAPIPTETPKPVATTAKVKGVGTTGLRMRKAPGTSASAAIIRSIPEGETVTIVSGDFPTVDGIQWVQISYKDQTGWVAREYLDKTS